MPTSVDDSAINHDYDPKNNADDSTASDDFMRDNYAALSSDKHADALEANNNKRRMRNQIIKKCTLNKVLIISGVFSAIFIATRIITPIFLGERNYLLYFYLIEIAVVGFVLTRLLGQLVFRILIDSSKSQAASSRSILTIAGYLATVSIIVASLAQDPTVTVAISTITGIVLGISAQSLIGNAIAGMVLAVSRPFRIGDTITAFGNTGVVGDIGLLYTRILTAEGNIMMIPNTTLLTTAILKQKTGISDNAGAQAA
jgi:small-conductance mechanosensitive channel